MSDETTDPRARPVDPAGTRPKHDPADLLPRNPAPLLAAPAIPPGVVDASAVEELPGPEVPGRDGHAEPDAGERVLLPARRPGDAVGPVGEVPVRAQARIHFVLGALLAIGAAALAAVALIATAPEDESRDRGPAWSSWRPEGDAQERVGDIADHVGRKYRGAGGQQLVAVTGGPLEISGVPLSVVLREPAAQGGDIELQEGDGVLFRMCGLGDKCAIASGKPSRERHQLLRREALELALYALHYVDTDQVVVLMPPPKGKDPDQALFFRREDLSTRIEQPLVRTLSTRTPSVATVRTAPDSSFVNDVTIESLFTFSLTQGNTDNQGFLVLDPLTAQAP